MAIIRGDENDNTIVDGNSGNRIEGLGGDDDIRGGGGDDLILGGIGFDTLSGDAGSDGIVGEAGDDFILGLEGDDRLDGGSGNDFLWGGAGADTLRGGDGIDWAFYHDSRAPVLVNIGDGTSTGLGGDAEGDKVAADIENLAGSPFGDTLRGSAANNRIEGNAGFDRLSGAGGDDVLVGGNGPDELLGGEGLDWAIYTGPIGVSVEINLFSGHCHGGDAEGDTVSTDVENIQGTNADDALTGSSDANWLKGEGGADMLSGRGGADVLEGAAADDTLSGGVGADRLDGGAGNDTASYVDGVIGVTVDLATGRGRGGDAEGDTLVEVENVTGSRAADSITGNASANVLRGFEGNDLLRGGGGADTLDGGTGTDTATYFGLSAAITVDLTAGIGSGGDAQGDTYSGIENVNGGLGGDAINGDAGANLLQGFGGNDLLGGGGGGDQLVGGAGADRLEGGAGLDAAIYSDGSVGVRVNLATGKGTGGNAAGDTLVGIENVRGSNGADTLTGNSGANVLNGWAGKDVLTGAGGADIFALVAAGHSAVGANADRITDFSRSQRDRIDLSDIDANTRVAGDQGFSFIGSGLYTGVAGQLRFAQSGGVTTIAGDINGDRVSDFHIQLTGTIGLVAGDFML